MKTIFTLYIKTFKLHLKITTHTAKTVIFSVSNGFLNADCSRIPFVLIHLKNIYIIQTLHKKFSVHVPNEFSLHFF